MTWVLILTPNGNDKWPAIIGGYPSKDEAVHAGKMATNAQYRMERAGTWEKWLEDHPSGGFLVDGVPNDWVRFVVIPGAASMESTNDQRS